MIGSSDERVLAQLRKMSVMQHLIDPVDQYPFSNLLSRIENTGFSSLSNADVIFMSMMIMRFQVRGLSTSAFNNE